MGYDLSCTLGFGVKIEEFEEEPLLTPEQRDIVEDLYCTESPIHIEYAGTDACNSVYILHKDSIIGADWLGSSFKPKDIQVEKTLIYASELQKELLKHNIIISGELFKWWLLPLWF